MFDKTSRRFFFVCAFSLAEDASAVLFVQLVSEVGTPKRRYGAMHIPRHVSSTFCTACVRQSLEDGAESLREASSDTFLAFKRLRFSRANFAPFSLFQFGQRFGVLPLRASQSARTHATAYPRVTPFAAMGSTVSTPKPPNPEGASAQATVPLTEKPAPFEVTTTLPAASRGNS
jgi:hypothetical protein